MKLGHGTKDMTSGPIAKAIVLFSLPLMLGNAFQMLYNTVDIIVVGNFVSKQALAAVGSTTMIVNILVFFFNGFSVGAGVVIGHHFGARDMKRLHAAVETTMALTFLICIVFTALGIFGVKPMLRLMATPDDVFADATTYLTIYFAGIAGLLIYNMGSGILRAVGNTVLPLLFLILTSGMNIALDLVFVLVFSMGIEGVAYATILSQFVSALLVLFMLSHTNEIYRFVWRDLTIDGTIVKRIFSIGLPAGIQSVITSVSNVFVQSYINFFGSDCMAGWSCYNKLDQFILLPMQSMAMAATSFVSQNIGAGKKERADRGTRDAILITTGVTAVIAVALFIFARPATWLFTTEEAVVEFGALFIQTNVFFLLANCVNHVLAGSLRGRGDARAPMVIMLLTFVALRQVYLFVMTRFIMNTPRVVGFGYPVGWMACMALELTYFIVRYRRGNAIGQERA